MTETRKSFGKRKGGKGSAYKRRRRRPILKYGLIAFVVLISGAGGYGLWWWHTIFSDMPALPETAELWVTGREPATEFRAANGDLIAIRGPRYGRVVRLGELPPHVPQAFIGAEDKRFYEHEGADTQAIIRAAWSNWRSGRTVSGASTITQQLIKNLVLDSRQTLKRKAQEIRLARQLETRLTKDEILELYLNRVYFGAGFYGLDAASRHYFGKPPAELTVGEAALLAALPKAPSRLALTGNLEEARARQAYVLGEMVDAGFLSDSAAAAASVEPITLIERPLPDPQMGYVLDLAVEQVSTLLEDAPPDLVVTLAIEPELQRSVHAAVTQQIAEKGEALKASQAAAIVIRRDGAIAALVGGLDYETSEFNRATQARRQPGSAFKAFVYAAALEAGVSPYDVRQDVPLKIGRWQPANYTGDYLGPVTIAEAFAASLNTIAAQLTQEIGEDAVIDMARKVGISATFEPLPSIALGSQEVTLIDLARGFGTFMRDGERLDPYLVTRIEDTRGNSIWEHEATPPLRALSQGVSRDMTGMMVRTLEDGTGMAGRVNGWTVAGKTGTSQDWRDGWFVGFAQPAVTAIWVGNDDDSAMEKVTGGGLPAEIFADVMALALADQRPARLAGAERYVALSDAAEERITFYRNLAGAFSTVAKRDVASIEGARRTE